MWCSTMQTRVLNSDRESVIMQLDVHKGGGSKQKVYMG